MNAGAAREDITPPIGTSLAGFAGRDWAATGVRDPLSVTALWLDGAVILSLDIIGLSVATDRRGRRHIGAALGLSPEAVFLSCTHTHSGPATQPLRATGIYEAGWTSEILTRATRAALRARDSAKPAHLAVGEASCDASVNRRNPQGPHDPVVRVLQVAFDSEPPILLWHYAMHPVALGRDNTLLSADWVGVARSKIEAVTGRLSLFLQGCCGDINPRFSGTRGEEETVKAGKTVSESVRQALNSLRPLPKAPIQIGFAEARVPLLPLPNNLLLTAAEQSPEGNSLAEQQLNTAYRDWAVGCRKLGRRKPEGLATARLSVGVFRIGDWNLTALPGECFAQIGLDIGGCALGYARGNPGYLYPDIALVEGGYETEVAFKLYGLQGAGAGTAKALIEAARWAMPPSDRSQSPKTSAG
ncbi:MAG: neutral/alkaline non-lysosomal ceramidase N-terminal domain-containing protein [Armatimonas sp.]